MKNYKWLYLVSLILISLPAYAGLKAVAVYVPVASTVTPTFNSTTAASANTTLIQSALNAGGQVNINCASISTSETDTIPASGPYQITVANAGTFYGADTGVIYTSNGNPLTKVYTSTVSTGQYSVSAQGQYTFAAADTGLNVAITYSYIPPFYTNAHVTIGSNTNLNVPKNCHWEQATGGDDNMLVNAAYVAPWNQNVQINSGLIANGPLTITWDGTPTQWAQSTGYTTGSMAYVTGTGALFWEATASCTSSGTGTGPVNPGSGSGGPTGTSGSAVTDGTCTWYYMTTRKVLNQGQNVTATVYIPNHGLVTGQALWLNPQPDNVGSTYQYYSGNGTAQTAGGPSDMAYFGVWPIINVNDANYVTVVLHRQPAATFTGIPIEWKVADQNIKIGGGGTLDYNGANQTQPVLIKDHAIIIAGVQNLRVDDLYVYQPLKYLFEGSGLSGFEISHIQGSPAWTQASTNGDQIHLTGQIFDGYIHDINGEGSDDVIALLTTDAANSTYYQLAIATGDVIGVRIENVSSWGGLNGVSMWGLQPLAFIDQIEMDRIGIHNGGAYAATGGGVGFPLVKFSGLTSSQPNFGTANFGTIIVRNIQQREAGNYIVDTTSGVSSIHVQNLVMQSIQSTRTSINGGTADLIKINPGTGYTHTFDNIVCRDCYDNTTAVASAPFHITQSGTGTTVVTNLLISGGLYTSSTGVHGQLVWEPQSSNVTLSHVTIENANISNFGGIMDSLAAGTFDLTGNYITGTTTINLVNVAGGVYHLNHNTFSGATSGVVRFASNVGVKVYSDGENILTGSSIWTSGTGTITGFNLIDVAQNNPPTTACAGTGLSATSTNLSGNLQITSASSCLVTFSAQAYASAPRGCQATDASGSNLVGIGCAITWSSPTSGSLTVTGTALTNINYLVTP